jgi:hypothetical protein
MIDVGPHKTASGSPRSDTEGGSGASGATEATGTKNMGRITLGEPDFADIAGNAATADVLFELGMMYCIGRGVAKDYVTAHKWFNLAAMKGSEDAKIYRRELATEMSAAEIAEAQRQARSWLTLH